MRLFLVVLVALLPVLALAQETKPGAQDLAVESRVMALSQDLRCLVCQGESLADSNADLARDLRQEIREMVLQGKSDRQIKDYLVQRYGDFILFRPPVKSTTLFLWYGPFLLLTVGTAALFLILKRRRSRTLEPELSEEELARARSLLDGGKQAP